MLLATHNCLVFDSSRTIQLHKTINNKFLFVIKRILTYRHVKKSYQLSNVQTYLPFLISRNSLVKLYPTIYAHVQKLFENYQFVVHISLKCFKLIRKCYVYTQYLYSNTTCVRTKLNPSHVFTQKPAFIQLGIHTYEKRFCSPNKVIQHVFPPYSKSQRQVITWCIEFFLIVIWGTYIFLMCAFV